MRSMIFSRGSICAQAAHELIKSAGASAARKVGERVLVRYIEGGQIGKKGRAKRYQSIR